METLSSAIWAGVVLYLLWRAETGFKSWLAHQAPLNKVQEEALSKRIAAQDARITSELDRIQNQVNGLALESKNYDN